MHKVIFNENIYVYTFIYMGIFNSEKKMNLFLN